VFDGIHGVLPLQWAGSDREPKRRPSERQPPVPGGSPGWHRERVAAR
jgi:hypothetical protein